MKQWKLDTGNDGEDEILYGETVEEIIDDILHYQDLARLPDHWSIEEVIKTDEI